MEPMQYEASGALRSPAARRNDRFQPRESRAHPVETVVEPGANDAADGTFHGVPMTSRVVAAMQSYSSAGTFAALFAFVAGALAHRGVVENAPVCHPAAALAIIAAVTVLVGMRIRLLSVMEEVCIANGADEREAKSRARSALDALLPGTGRRVSR
jgi:hypothetical protein